MTVAGADRVIAVDAIPERLELARAFGADDALNRADLTTPEARIQAVMDLTGGFGGRLRGVPGGHSGGPADAPRAGGCYLEVGSIAPGNIFSYDATTMVGGAVRFVACANYSPALAQALAFLRQNLTRFPFQRLVSHVFPRERISEGFRQADWIVSVPSKSASPSRYPATLGLRQPGLDAGCKAKRWI